MDNSNRLPSREDIINIRRRLALFDDVMVEHRIQREVETALLRELLFPTVYNMILLIGATGVGKTTLLELIKRELEKFAESDPEFLADAGRIAVGVVYLEIVAGKPFSWNKYYRDCMAAFCEPLPDHKVSYETVYVQVGNDEHIAIKRRGNSETLHEAFKNTLANRRPYGFLHDDGQYLTKRNRGSDFIDQLDTVKTLADKTNVPFVLFGTHDMHHLIALNEQLDRRTQIILYPRYKEENDADLAEYKNILATFENNLPIEKKPNLVARAEWFFKRSLGCVGMLKDWLSQALKRYLEPGNTREFLEICEELALSDERLQIRLGLITKGEQAVANLLAKSSRVSPEPNKAASENNTQPKRNTKPGERKPSRDAVGIK